MGRLDEALRTPGQEEDALETLAREHEVADAVADLLTGHGETWARRESRARREVELLEQLWDGYDEADAALVTALVERGAA